MTTHFSRRAFLKTAGAGAAAALAAPAIGLSSRTVNAATPIQAILNRYPAQEYFAEQMKSVPGVEVNVQLMPNDKILELLNINLSSGSSTFDIIPCNDTQAIRYARNGWIIPLEELWEKYRDEYNLGDIEPNFIKGSTVDGHLYQLPNEFNSHIQMYRKDIYEEKGLKPEDNIEDFKAHAKSLKSDDMAGTVLLFRAGDQCATGATYYFNNVGDGWFHDDWKLAVNTERGIKAVEFMREMAGVAQRGFTTASGEEGALALAQGLAAMGHMWVTRASNMEDPKKSRVVGKISYAAPAQGKQRLSATGYAISKFSKQDPDVLFRVMLQTASEKAARENIKNNVPPRVSILNDEELSIKHPYLIAANGAAKYGAYYPAMPHFSPVAEIVTRRIVQVMTDELQAKEAMDLAAAEGNKYLVDQGFIKA
ncbi:extracellular solute-binding protein [Mesorhizobium sp. YR577]|uniref:ABC transporter substrate-binding protein n=1 Tax=Mesorhizobium sp. YR577 TaxID=1884373 RepID=UPI0008EA8499|nr:extracellular solute-binding protein [Mesorhizobium sp. YR577]SFU19627.1 carbohydrate ABC transporter substrate-binding protein, CUT1 family [Mesorhizobium sp. YR577]